MESYTGSGGRGLQEPDCEGDHGNAIKDYQNTYDGTVPILAGPKSCMFHSIHLNVVLPLAISAGL